MASTCQVDCRERPGMATNMTIPRWSWVRRLPETGELLARPHRTRGRRSPDPHENAENPPVALPKCLADLGHDPEFGARPLERVIQKNVQNVLAEAILRGELGPGQKAVVDVHEGLFMVRANGAAVGA